MEARLRSMRIASRGLAQNNDFMRRFVHMVKSNVVGVNGIQRHPDVRDPGGAPDVMANRLITAGWRDWTRRGVCTTDGKLSWVDAQRLFISTVAVDGECLAHRLKGWKGNKYRYAIRFLDVDLLDENYSARLPNGRYIRMSVEFDQYDRPVAYWLLRRHPGETMGYTGSAGRDRYPADEIIHAFIADRPNQPRGVPWAHTAAKRMYMLDGWEEGALVNARTAAAKMGFFTPENPDIEYEGEDEDGETGAEAEAPIMEAEPGLFEQLPPGMDFKPWTPDYPDAAFEPFHKHISRGIASGLNVAYVGLANNLQGVNLSSIRQGSLDEQEYWRELQTWMIDNFCSIVATDWLEMALTTQAVPLPIAKFEKFVACKWKPRGWKRVDPKKEADSNEKQLQMLTKSPQKICAETGEELETVIQEIADAVKLAKSKGLRFTALSGLEVTENAEA